MVLEPIVIEKIFQVPARTLWDALTVNEQMKQWYFQLAEFKPVKGFEFQFEGGNDGRVYVHKCVITEVVPESRLTYSWRYDEHEGISYVTFELIAEGNKTKLKLTHRGLESFPASNADFARENFVEGWTHIIGTSLKDFVEKMPVVRS